MMLGVHCVWQQIWGLLGESIRAQATAEELQRYFDAAVWEGYIQEIFDSTDDDRLWKEAMQVHG